MTTENAANPAQPTHAALGPPRKNKTVEGGNRVRLHIPQKGNRQRENHDKKTRKRMLTSIEFKSG